MIAYRNNSPAILSAFMFTLMAALWIAFAPMQAGGQAAYIVVIGNSMEPKFHRGDLVIVHSDTNYTINDIVAYKNAQLKSNVIHRIIDSQNNRFILKGDNNAWVDTYQPAVDEVIGKSWIHIPGGGSVIQRIRTPLNMALIAGALAGFLMISFPNQKTKGSKRMKNKSWRDWFNGLKNRLSSASASHPQTDTEQKTLSNSEPYLPKNSSFELNGPVTETLFFLLGLITFVCLILGIISLTRPATISTPDDVLYQNIGLFSYSATVPAGIYDANTLQTGQPIFPKLTCSTELNFHYALVGDGLSDIAGNYQITAQLIEPQSGWQRTITLLPDTAFTGSSFDTSAKLNFCEIIKLTETLEAQTDFHPSQYTLLITPDITLSGTIAGRELQDANYQPQLTFRYDRLNFSVVKADATTNPFNQTQASFIREIQQKANTITLLGWHPTIMTLRLIALIGLVISVGGIWLLSRSVQEIISMNPEAGIRQRYSSILIEIQNADMTESAHIVDVRSIDDLAKLAERYNTMILHQQQDGKHLYFANTEGTIYRYILDTQMDASK